MTKMNDQRSALQEWAEQFPDFTPWKNQFLIRRNGGLISGICLDKLRDPNAYKPTFFFHNLLVPSPVVTLAYAAPLLSRGVYKPVKYGHIGESIKEFRMQVPIDEIPSISKFVDHVSASRAGKHGAQAIYIPHFFRDVITLGISQEPRYLETIDTAVEVISNLSGINLNLIGSIADWKFELLQLANRDSTAAITDQIKKLKLPAISDGGFRVETVVDFWNI
jgi:hypothetical protein